MDQTITVYIPYSEPQATGGPHPTIPGTELTGLCSADQVHEEQRLGGVQCGTCAMLPTATTSVNDARLTLPRPE